MFGIGMGPSGHEIGDRDQLQQDTGFATGQGEQDITAGTSFMRDILSGDPSKIATALAPQISAQQQQISQNKKTNAEFGTRSGGTAAANATADAGGRSNLLGMEGSMRSEAASGLSAMGQNLFSKGMTGTSTIFDMDKIMHDQSQAQDQNISATFGNMLNGAMKGMQSGGGVGGAIGGAAGGMLSS